MRTLIEIVGQTPTPPVVMPPEATVRDACREMHQHQSDTVLITDDQGDLIGIFTATDVTTRVIEAGRSPAKAKLRDVMTAHPFTLAPNSTALDALRAMWDGGFAHVPVTNSGRPIGCVSPHDFKGDEIERHAEERELWEHMR